MPPKKKGGKKKKKKEDGELTVDDRYKKTLEEMEALKDHLALRKELARRSQTASQEMRDRLMEAETTLEQKSQDIQQVHSGMTRQYKEMEKTLVNTVDELRMQLSLTQAKLEITATELEETKKELADTVEAKDLQIHDLQNNIKTMEKTYDMVLKDCLDHLEKLVTASQDTWKRSGVRIQQKNKDLLFSLGLNPLDL